MIKRVKLVADEPIRCTECKSPRTVRHGYNVTKTGRWARRKCQECGTTFYENQDRGKKGGTK